MPVIFIYSFSYPMKNSNCELTIRLTSIVSVHFSSFRSHMNKERMKTVEWKWIWIFECCRWIWWFAVFELLRKIELLFPPSFLFCIFHFVFAYFLNNYHPRVDICVCGFCFFSITGLILFIKHGWTTCIISQTWPNSLYSSPYSTNEATHIRTITSKYSISERSKWIRTKLLSSF